MLFCIMPQVVFKVYPPPPSKKDFFRLHSNAPTAAGKAWMATLRCITENVPDLPFRYPCAVHVDLYVSGSYMTDYIPVILYAIKHSYMIGLDNNMLEFSASIFQQNSSNECRVVFNIRSK